MGVHTGTEAPRSKLSFPLQWLEKHCMHRQPSLWLCCPCIALLLWGSYQWGHSFTALYASTLCEVVDNPQLHGDLVPGSSCVVSMSDIANWTHNLFASFCTIFGSVVSAPGKWTGTLLVLYAFYISRNWACSSSHSMAPPQLYNVSQQLICGGHRGIQEVSNNWVVRGFVLGC